MSFLGRTILKSEYILHETKRNVLFRFLSILTIVLLYFIFMSYKYGINDGFSVTLLTWAFFVLCTPIADAGFILDFPLRVIAKIRMIYSEIFVWFVALSSIIFNLVFNIEIFDKTTILKLFKVILLNPIPYWIIILISMAGTFLSIYFGDELLDIARHKHRKKYQKHKNKHKIIIILFVIILLISFYFYMITKLGINIPKR